MKTEISKNYIKSLLEEGKRIDKRKLDELRDLEIEFNTAGKAEGSATVTLGKTKVLAGVKIEIGEPFPDTPDEGVLRVNAELGPIASPEFEVGPPRERGIELARVVDRGIRESEAIPLKDLCIKPEEKVLMVSLDIDILNHDGNLIDASGIASIAALLTTKLPKVEDGKIDRENFSDKLPIKEVPVPITVGKIKDILIVDPCLEEENALDVRLTATSMKNGFCAMQKGRSGSLKEEEIMKSINYSEKLGKKVRKKIKQELKKVE